MLPSEGRLAFLFMPVPLPSSAFSLPQIPRGVPRWGEYPPLPEALLERDEVVRRQAKLQGILLLMGNGEVKLRNPRESAMDAPILCNQVNPLSFQTGQSQCGTLLTGLSTVLWKSTKSNASKC